MLFCILNRFMNTGFVKEFRIERGIYMYRALKTILLVGGILVAAGLISYIGFILYTAKKASYYSRQENEDSITAGGSCR